MHFDLHMGQRSWPKRVSNSATSTIVNNHCWNRFFVLETWVKNVFQVWRVNSAWHQTRQPRFQKRRGRTTLVSGGEMRVAFSWKGELQTSWPWILLPPHRCRLGTQSQCRQLLPHVACGQKQIDTATTFGTRSFHAWIMTGHSTDRSIPAGGPTMARNDFRNIPSIWCKSRWCIARWPAPNKTIRVTISSKYCNRSFTLVFRSHNKIWWRKQVLEIAWRRWLTSNCVWSFWLAPKKGIQPFMPWRSSFVLQLLMSSRCQGIRWFRFVCN